MERKNEIIYNGVLTGTLSEAKEKAKEKNEGYTFEIAEEYGPIQQVWNVNPSDDEEHQDIIGYKES